MDTATGLAYSFVETFNNVILFPTIALLMAVAMLVFMYGCFIYILRGGDPSARAQGVRHITWGIVGVVIMLSAYTIISIAAGTFGLDDELDCANDPFQTECARLFSAPNRVGESTTGQTQNRPSESTTGQTQNRPSESTTGQTQNRPSESTGP